MRSPDLAVTGLFSNVTVLVTGLATPAIKDVLPATSDRATEPPMRAFA